MKPASYEIPPKFLDSADQSIEQAASYFSSEYATMLKENVKEMSPHYLRSKPDANP